MSDFFKSNFSVNKSDEIKLSDETFFRLRDTIYKLSGIYFNESKKYLLESRILKRIQVLKLDAFESYLQKISALNGREELKNLFDVITINETYFFRAEFQIEALESHIIPELVAAKLSSNNNKIRIWSAACSTGEEPYTISMVIENNIKAKYPEIKFEIFASDLSQEVIKNAEKGLYNEYSIRNLPKDYFIKYFTRVKDKFEIDESIRNMVEFKNINLYDSFSINQLEKFDVIFCENVLIYFDPVSKEKVITNLYNAFNDGGYLFIGTAESLHNVKQNFDLIHFPKAMAYRR